ncbi:MAG: 4-alpha-glucanotransferase [candidate division TA06 bacterium ADurb.Bin131]|uniref:4-alpha-glucanotransferase n=1 Tax=candidate division TA06 bacterium ADurb.Bin131 TaxID=1852827 RepID=A0A1V6C7X0_UNCT6|nr:MAG: 4-alpha-glucanotransferase [candidate division TA06 bacterium ADurb.Bin131]HON06330.1 4-alpha-glucanotransferase [bacterium]
MSFEELFSTFQGNKWRKIGIKKKSGICTPLFSVYSSESTGIGDFNDIKKLVDFCRSINATILQFLPLNMCGMDNCPYNAVSSFAIDPIYISLSSFSYDGLICPDRLISDLRLSFVSGKNNRCNYSVREEKLRILRNIFNKVIDTVKSDISFALFVRDNEYWIDEFAVYRVLKNIHNNAPWYEWEDFFANVNHEKIEDIRYAYNKDILFEKWIQFICFQQMASAKRYANDHGVLLMGDLPVLVSKDSADVWAKRELFNLNYSAGAPPDMYCVYGQRWGMPIQNWDIVKKHDFRYIIEKFKFSDNFFDMMRIDHVIGLFRIWSIPIDDPVENQGLNGVFIPSDEGIWKQHGSEILHVMNENSNCLLCAEDLGVIPDICPAVLKEFGIPGYDVQRWKKRYGYDYSFIPSSEYRQSGISTLSTHDTSFWLEWWRNEVGTVERELIELKSRIYNLDSRDLIERLFESTINKSDRLKWKKEINSVEKLCDTVDRKVEEIRDIVEIYLDTFDEKNKLKTALNILDDNNEIDCLKKSFEFIYNSSSIFRINLLPDIMCLDKDIAKKISHLRINKPGTTSQNNWSFAFEQPLEDFNKSSALEKIQECIPDII